MTRKDLSREGIPKRPCSDRVRVCPYAMTPLSLSFLCIYSKATVSFIVILAAILGFFAGCDDFNRPIKDKADFYLAADPVDSWEKLEAGINTAPEGTILALTKSLPAKSGIPTVYAITRTVTIAAMPGVTAVIPNTVFTVGPGGNLTLGNSVGGRLVVEGNSTQIHPNSIVTVTNGGSFALRDGAELRNNQKRLASTAKGGGVYVENAVFTMSGGVIAGNKLVSTVIPSATMAGGVYLGPGAVFTMTGGLISNNDVGASTTTFGGGVVVDGGGYFKMAGGTISGNKAEDYSGSGAGVYVVRRDFLDGPGGVFEMTGGTISGNKAGSMGGGVCIESGYANLYREGVFTMKGGTITGNTAGTNGYVPYVPPGYKAGRSGGGVFAGGRFAMTGGTISGNNVENNNTDNPSLILATGGGVCVGAYGVFIMTGGTIRGNSAADFGGGVSVAPFDDTHFILGGAAVVAADNTVYLDIDSGPPSVSAFVMAASPLAPPGGISAVLEPADTSAGMALVKGYANTGPDDPLPSYTLTPADLGKFRYKQGGTLVPLEFSNGEGLIP